MLQMKDLRGTSRFVRQKRGFTLVELAIVLAVAGLLFVGLWRLLSSGNQQVRDQSAASQQTLLIASIKGYLSSAEGQAYMGSQASYTMPLGLPSTNAPGNCVPTTANTGSICNYLPSGFTNTTANSYGQTYSIQILKDNNQAGANGKPTNYSFMILTTGGDTIPDTSGGRISAFIGGDGGFIYTNLVCGTAPASQWACGSYGSWLVNVTLAGPTSYGFGASAAGHIASRTFVSASAENQFPWLARLLMPNDPTYSWNTMTTDLYMGGVSTQTGPGLANIYMAPFNTTAGGSALFMQGGTINLGGGTITGTGTSNVQLTGNANTLNPLINVTNAASPGCPITNPNNPTNCQYGINTDSINVGGLLNAVEIYASTFIYNTSDARLKTNIHPIADSLSDIMKLKPVAFTLKSNGQNSLGVIAQDLEKVYPELVTKDPGMKAVNYDGLIAPLIGAVQQLKQENDYLRQKLREQEQRENILEQKIKTK